MLHNNTSRALSALGLALMGAFFMSCTDPVRDRQIERLGGEAGNVPMGPLHRPGQPCVLCHSDGGPASGKFAVAGTIFETSAADSKGAADVRVLFIDAASAQREATTNEAGNFYLTDAEWPDLTYPFKVGILKGNMPVRMRSTINREPSCNFCHKPNPGSKLSLPGDDSRESVGQVFVTAQAGGT